MLIFLWPVSSPRALEEASKAVEASNLDKTLILSKAGRKAKMGLLMVTGLKVCTDPTAPPLKKFIAGTKLLCCGDYTGANVVSSMTAIAPQIKVSTSACCAISWALLSGLEYAEAKANL